MKKIIGVFALIMALSACDKNEEYVSKRHPEGENTSVEENISEENSDQAEEASQENPEELAERKENKDLADGVEFRVEDTVNMRLAPSVDSAVVAEISPDDEILNLGETEGWTRVTVNGKTGYIRSDLLIKK